MFDIKNRAKPLIKWAGGKSSLLGQIIAHFPQQKMRFFEPFLGGGAVFLALDLDNSAVINDCNAEMINLYTIVRDQPAALMAALDALETHYSEEFYYKIRAQAVDFSDAVAAAARTVFLNKTGFNGLYRQNKKGEFNVPFGKRAQCPALYDRQNLLHVQSRLRRAAIHNTDFEEILALAGAGDFVYCDPPYEPVSQTSSFNAYVGGGFDQGAQRRLKNACEAAASRGAVVAVSNSATPFIKELYADWNIQIVSAKRAINSNAAKRGAVDECLVLMDAHQRIHQSPCAHQFDLKLGSATLPRATPPQSHSTADRVVVPSL